MAKVQTYDVYVKNLPLNADEKNVGKVFSPFGETASMFVRVSKTGDYKYAFIKYFSEADANKAVDEVNGKEFDGKAISVQRDFKQIPVEDREKPRNKRHLPKPTKKPDLLPEVSQNRPPPSDHRREKEREDVFVTHVENPVSVWIQIVTTDNTEKLTELTEQLAALCPAAPKVLGPVQPGKIYATMFSEDQLWYRCQIKQSLGSDTIKVQYTDYGNTEEVKNEHLVEIPQSLASVKPFASKLILHNCYAHDLSDQNGIDFLKKLTENQIIQAQRTIPLKDNQGYYGMLYIDDICLNEQVKEQGYAYARPAMTSATGTQKTDEPSGTGIFASIRNTGSPLSPFSVPEQIIGSGGGYADSGGGGYGDNLGPGPLFGGRRSDGKPQNKLNSFAGVIPDEVERLKQELAKKNMQLQHVLSQATDTDILKQELNKKSMQLHQLMNSKNEGSQEAAKVMQTKLMKKQRELDQTKAELGKKTLLLQQMQTKRIDITQVTEMCEKVRNLRCQFPTGQKSVLEDAISITLSSDKIFPTSLTTLQSVVSVNTRYNLIQKEILSCTDKAEVENLINSRDDAREELYEKMERCLEELDSLPLDRRCHAIEKIETQVRRDYAPFLAFNVHNNPALEDLVPGFNDWKMKREAECKQIRALTSSFESTVEQNIHHLSKMMKLDSSGFNTAMPMPWDELLTRYAQLLQQEILRTDLEQTSDGSLIAAVVKAILKELSIEMNHINHYKNLQAEFKDTKAGIEPWLQMKPNTDELTEIKKMIRGLKSKLRHKEADRQDLVEAGDCTDELKDVKVEIEKLKSDLHKALLSQEKVLLSLAKATSDHFPELFYQFEDLGIKSLLLYNGLVSTGRELEHYTLSQTWIEGMWSSLFAGEPVYLQEFIIGDTDHVDKEMFIKNVCRFREVACKCPQLPHVQSVFFVKNDRFGYIQMEFPEVICLQEIVKAELDIQLRQKIIENITKAVQCLHDGHIVHGEINPCNIGYTPDGQTVLLCPDFSKSLEDRLKKPFVADNGLYFRCPEVACGRSAGTKSTDMYCLGLVILWLYFPTLSIPMKADGYPRLSELQMDPQISTLLYNLLCNPDSRLRANQVLDSEYVKANLDVPSSRLSDSSTEDMFSTSNSICTVIDFSETLPPCQDVLNICSENLNNDSYPSVHDTRNTGSTSPIDSFPVVSQFDPLDMCDNQDAKSQGIFANSMNSTNSSMEMLANCLLQMPPLSELPGLPESDQEISESYQKPDGIEEEITGGNITPITEELDESHQDNTDFN